MVQGPDEFRWGDNTTVSAHLPDFFSQDPERQCHEARAESHDREKGIPIPVSGAGCSKHGKCREIGCHHGAQ